jgi:O-antigen ligase
MKKKSKLMPANTFEVFKGIQGLQLAVMIGLIIFIPIPQAGMMSVAFCLWLLAGGLLASLSVFRWLLGETKQDLGQAKASVAASFPWVLLWLLITAICFFHVVYKLPITNYWLSEFKGVEVLQPAFNSTSSELMSFAKLQTLGAWAFFTVFWTIAYVASRFNLDQLRWLLGAVLFMGIFQAVMGIGLMQAGSLSVFGLWEKIYYVSDATGTFVNHNHYANFLALCLPLGLSALLGDRPLIMRSFNKYYRTFAAIVFTVLVLLAAVASHSRMGLFVTMVAGLVWVLFDHLRSRRQFKSTDQRVTWVMIGLIGLVMLWFGLSDITKRVMSLSDGDGRLQIWQSVFDLPQQVWIFGIGPGNFSEVYALVKPIDIGTFLYYAHSDYLEFVLEFGLIGTALIALTWFWWLIKSFKGSVFKDVSSLRAAALCTLIAMAIHSAVDFSFQIPANATYTALALGILVNQNLNRVLKRRLKAS